MKRKGKVKHVRVAAMKGNEENEEENVCLRVCQETFFETEDRGDSEEGNVIVRKEIKNVDRN